MESRDPSMVRRRPQCGAKCALVAVSFWLVSDARVGAQEPPVITPLVPGIVVDELPVRLPNINNLRFTPEGRLAALGYNGNVYLLKDTDGDALEDAADVFWDRPTIRVPVGMAWTEKGVYVSSHGKVSLLRDTNGDGHADDEQIVAQGWPETDVASGGVDATAVTLDREGNVYFALLCADYSNPYRVRDGRSHYDRNSPRGTIMRLSADHRQRDVICTGMRVPYTLAFNRHGDLFVTDQEGATWLPDGNPLDELNQILPGRHYGFPPRHAEYLPDVVDEPPVVAFGPQHQSTCGLVFNEASPGRASFGPVEWEGDALVAGLSRGRLWRVPLQKTPHGYVGRPQTVAMSTMLLADVALAANGDLYVTCHSGPPDWGTGPQGEGRLLRLRYANRAAPQPLLVHPAGPLETHIVFDRPVDESIAATLVGRTIEYGEHVHAGDRLEVLKPPYETVEQQAKVHRGTLPILGATLSADGRTLSLRTPPHPVRSAYAISLPPIHAADDNGAGADRELEFDYDLHGVQAGWVPSVAGESEAWSGWLPHVDTAVSRSLCGGSPNHDRLFRSCDNAGTLRLASLIDLPPGAVTLRLYSATPCRVSLATGAHSAAVRDATGGVCELNVDLPAGQLPMEIAVDTVAARRADIHVTYQRDGDVERVVEFNRLAVPWTPPQIPSSIADSAAPQVATTGDPRQGEQLFFGSVAKCADCHTIHGRGAKFAPDLSNLAHRSHDSLLRDIREPSAAINPDYLSYSVVLKDGRVLSGTVRGTADAGSLQLVDNAAKQTVVSIDDIESLTPAAISMMPTGLLDVLTPAGVLDLLAFLQAPPREPRQIRITLVDGVQDHGPGEHDYPAWQASWAKLLGSVEGVTVHTARDWPTAEQWKDSDAIVFYFWNHDWSAERYAQLDAFLARGGGAVVLHSALISDNDPESLAKRWGLAAQPVRTKYRHGPLELTFSANGDQPLVAGVAKLPLTDEPYWPMIGDPQQVRVLATTVEDGQERPMIWTFEPGRGRVFASIIGHYLATYDEPQFRRLLLRGIAWAAGEPPYRLQQVTAQATAAAQAK